MNIIKTTIVKTAREETSAAIYNFEYTITDKVLERVVATLFTPAGSAEHPEGEQYLGTITYEHENLYCNLPCTGRQAAPLITQFEDFLQQIKASIAENNDL